MTQHRLRIMALGLRGMPGVQGGVETHAEQLYRRLVLLGCDVDVIVRTPYVPPASVMLGAIKLHRIWAPRTAGFEALVHSVLGVIYAGFARPDILHVHAVGPAIVVPLARLLGLKVVVTHHGPDYDREKWGGFARSILRTGERLGMTWSHARIAISGVIVDMIRKKYGVESDLIPNGVEATTPSVETDTLERFRLVPLQYVLQVGRLVPEKRQLQLIRAFKAAALPGWKLVLVGGLDDSTYCRQVKAAADTSDVVLTDFQKGASLQQLYSQAGLFALPSSHEGLPIALLEALSYGLPVIASDIPANLEVGLPAENYFPTGDVATLASRIVELARTPQSPETRAANRKRVVERYNWDAIAELTLSLYSRVAG